MITIFGVVSYTLYDHWKEQLLFCIPNKIFQNASCPSHNHFCGHLSGKLCCRQKERLSPSAIDTCKLLQVSKTRWPFYFAWKLGKLDKILSRKKWKKEQPMAREEAARRMGRGAVPILRAASLLVNLSYNVFQRAKKSYKRLQGRRMDSVPVVLSDGSHFICKQGHFDSSEKYERHLV